MRFRAKCAYLFGSTFLLLTGVSAFEHWHQPSDQSRPRPQLCDWTDPSAQDAQRSEELRRSVGVITARVRHRLELVQKLRDGEITLFEAAAEFKRMNRLASPPMADALVRFGGASDNERVCRQVIHWLYYNTDELPPSKRQVVMQRVEAELSDHLARNGTVILEPSSDCYRTDR